METKNNPETGVMPLLTLKWDRYNKNFKNETTILWQDRPLAVKVHSFYDVAPMGQRIHFDFRYNNETYAYKILHSYMSGTNGKVPDLRNDTHKLTINAHIDHLEIYEAKLTSMEIWAAKMNNRLKSTEGTFNEETSEWEGENYPDRPNNDKESWFSVKKDLKTEEHEVPYNDSSLLLWIHKSFDYKSYYGGWLFKYDLFSPDLRPMQLKEGGFTCNGIYDFCQSIGCGNYCTIKFEISDNNGTVHPFRGFAQMEYGVIEVIEFMQSLRRFNDWDDYVTMKALAKSLSKTDVELDKMIASELTGTGIRMT
ncbi:MAG: hypothetical protein NTU98_08070 [Bacteroidetes bacterium]|nr:hypothetical protein [Bacteroidota bacterium]